MFGRGIVYRKVHEDGLSRTCPLLSCESAAPTARTACRFANDALPEKSDWNQWEASFDASPIDDRGDGKRILGRAARLLERISRAATGAARKLAIGPTSRYA
jgi:hypothetical protein